jgi:hypothetical protein
MLVIFLACGLVIVVALALYSGFREPGSRARDPRSGSQGSAPMTRSTTRAGLDAVIVASRQRVDADPVDGEAESSLLTR